MKNKKERQYFVIIEEDGKEIIRKAIYEDIYLFVIRDMKQRIRRKVRRFKW